MRFGSARQMIFQAYQFRRGDSAIASYFDDARRLNKVLKGGNPKLTTLIAEHKRNMRTLMAAGPNDPELTAKQDAVRLTEKRLSEVRIALADTTRSSSEGPLPDNDWKIVNGLEAGLVISRVEALPPHLRALALYLFGPESRRDMTEEAEIVQLALYQHLMTKGVKLPGQGKGLPSAEQLETLRYLCTAALYHHSEVTLPYRRTGLPTPQAVQRWLMWEHGIDVNVRRWSASGRACWGNVWERLVMTLDRWEGQALSPVAGLMPEVA